MKRIGIEVQRLFRMKKHGMEVVALELLKQLQQIDKLNEYIIYAKNDNDLNCFEESDNFKIKILPGYTYFDWEQFSFPKAVKKENLSFVHSTCNTSALDLSVPLLLTLHDIIYLEELNFKGTTYQNFGNIYRKIIVPKIVKKSKFIITVSQFEKNTIIEKLKVPEDKIKVVYNAINPKFNNNYSEKITEVFQKKYNLPDRFILFLGNTASKKNTKNVINAYVKYCRDVSSNIPLVILDYDAELVKSELRENNDLDLFKNFIFPGFISSDEMPLIYNSALLFLYPSLRESFGLPILEAMGCGTPVISSSTSSMPEVGGNAAIYVNPYSPIDIAEKINLILSDNQLQKKMSLKGITRASEFNWKKSAQDLLHIYENI